LFGIWGKSCQGSVATAAQTQQRPDTARPVTSRKSHQGHVTSATRRTKGRTHRTASHTYPSGAPPVPPTWRLTCAAHLAPHLKATEPGLAPPARARSPDRAYGLRSQSLYQPDPLPGAPRHTATPPRIRGKTKAHPLLHLFINIPGESLLHSRRDGGSAPSSEKTGTCVTGGRGQRSARIKGPLQPFVAGSRRSGETSGRVRQCGRLHQHPVPLTELL